MAVGDGYLGIRAVFRKPVGQVLTGSLFLKTARPGPVVRGVGVQGSGVVHPRGRNPAQIGRRVDDELDLLQVVLLDRRRELHESARTLHLAPEAEHSSRGLPKLVLHELAGDEACDARHRPGWGLEAQVGDLDLFVGLHSSEHEAPGLVVDLEDELFTHVHVCEDGWRGGVQKATPDRG